MKHKIIFQEIEIFAFHGVYEEEKKAGQIFLVDIELEVDLATASNSDNLKDTIDYTEFASWLSKIFTQDKYNLLEKLGSVLASAILENYLLVSKVKIGISKPQIQFSVPVKKFLVQVEKER